MTRGDDIELVWKALADPTRRKLLDELRAGRKTTGELCSAFPEMTRFAVMKHLGVLEAARLVIHRREGRLRWNHLNAVPLRQAYNHYVRPLEDQHAQSLIGLRELTEQGVREMTTATMPGVHIEQETPIAAPREKVWKALTENIGAWWGCSKATKQTVFRLEPRVGGRFYEEFNKDGDGVLFATVVYVSRNSKLVMQGTMSVVSTPNIGLITFELEEDGKGTLLKLSHKIMGDMPDEVTDGFRNGWKELLDVKLKGYVEN